VNTRAESKVDRGEHNGKKERKMKERHGEGRESEIRRGGREKLQLFVYIIYKNAPVAIKRGHAAIRDGQKCGDIISPLASPRGGWSALSGGNMNTVLPYCFTDQRREIIDPQPRSTSE
jgi:hypothetical protein